jgi:hypothetical protein
MYQVRVKIGFFALSFRYRRKRKKGGRGEGGLQVVITDATKPPSPEF